MIFPMTWKHGKRWVYSITYGEGCADLPKLALPLRRPYDILTHIPRLPGDVAKPLEKR
jgi:hypothetical protein